MSIPKLSRLARLIREEGLARQGKTVEWGDGPRKRKCVVEGDSERVRFEQGSEGLVHLITDVETGKKWRLKCFWEPHEERHRRSTLLSKQRLANPDRDVADALGGAPIAIVEGLGGETRFGVLMKNVGGWSWRAWVERAQMSLQDQYPPRGWPNLRTRLIWAYGLAVAVRNMEQRQFTHADLSPGNVLVTGEGRHSGDMALVDFDGFVCPACDVPDSHLKGTEGFAAPEVWQRKSLSQGSDRTAMALLIQEFLLIGHPEIPKETIWNLAYDQEEDLVNGKGRAKPDFRMLFPRLADMLDATLQARRPGERIAPSEWCTEVRALHQNQPGAAVPQPPASAAIPLAAPKNDSKRLVSVGVRSVQTGKAITVQVSDEPGILDLSQTAFRIRASLERKPDGQLFLHIHSGADLRVKDPLGAWHDLRDGVVIAVADGMHLSDLKGAANAQITGTWLKAASAVASE
jgi:hypothetical protein